MKHSPLPHHDRPGKVLSGFGSLEHGDFPKPRTASWAGCSLQAVTDSPPDQRQPLPRSSSRVQGCWVVWEETEHVIKAVGPSSAESDSSRCMRSMLLPFLISYLLLRHQREETAAGADRSAPRLPVRRVWMCLLTSKAAHTHTNFLLHLNLKPVLPHNSPLSALSERPPHLCIF